MNFRFWWGIVYLIFIFFGCSRGYFRFYIFIFLFFRDFRGVLWFLWFCWFKLAFYLRRSFRLILLLLRWGYLICRRLGWRLILLGWLILLWRDRILLILLVGVIIWWLWYLRFILLVVDWNLMWLFRFLLELLLWIVFLRGRWVCFLILGGRGIFLLGVGSLIGWRIFFVECIVLEIRVLIVRFWRYVLYRDFFYFLERLWYLYWGCGRWGVNFFWWFYSYRGVYSFWGYSFRGFYSVISLVCLFLRFRIFMKYWYFFGEERILFWEFKVVLFLLK